MKNYAVFLKWEAQHHKNISKVMQNFKAIWIKIASDFFPSGIMQEVFKV